MKGRGFHTGSLEGRMIECEKLLTIDINNGIAAAGIR